MFEALLAIYSIVDVYITPVSKVVLAASVVTMMTPTKFDDKILNFISSILNTLSLNRFKNTNKDS